MELKRFLGTFLRMSWLVILMGAVGLGVAEYSIREAPFYASDTKIFTLAKSSAGTVQGKIDYQDILTDRQLSNDYQYIVKSKKVMDMAQGQLKDLNITQEQLKNMISIGSQDNSSIVVLRAVSDKAEEARRVSQVVSNSFISTLEEMTKTDIVGIIDEPELPAAPIQNDNTKQILLGLLVGIGAAVMIIYITDILDTRIRFSEDIEHFTKLPMLAVIPKYDAKYTE